MNDANKIVKAFHELEVKYYALLQAVSRSDPAASEIAQLTAEAQMLRDENERLTECLKNLSEHVRELESELAAFHERR